MRMINVRDICQQWSLRRTLTKRKKAERQSRVRLTTESLEPRAMLAADFGAMIALDTPSDVVPFATDLAEYQVDRRWESTTVEGSGLSWGDATTITWSIAPDSTAIPGFTGEPSASSEFVSFMNRIYGSVAGSVEDQPWFSTVASVFERWSDVSGLDFVYEPHDDGAAFSDMAGRSPGAAHVRGDIRIGGHAIDGSSGTLAYNFFPNNGEMVLDTSDNFFFDTSSNSLRLRNVMSHELGHGIGLSHVDPVDKTKLMEPVAAIAFDGPQHDDILAVHRLYGDEFETDQGNNSLRTAVDLGAIGRQGLIVGNQAAGQYTSIDGSTDVDYFRFTADAGSRLDAKLIPVGKVYSQGAIEGSLDRFDSKGQNNLAFEIYDGRHQILARVDGRGLGANEALTDTVLAAGGEYFVRIHGDRDAAQLYRLELAVTDGEPADVLDFFRYSIDTYGGAQDHSGSTVIERGGSALHLTGNRWKQIDLTYRVTPETVLEFDFTSTAEGDIHGIGFDSDTSISSGLTFRLHGTQNWGLDDFNRYDASGDVQHFVIPVGRYFTGKATGLVFVNDHDVSSPTAESVFSNVRIYEEDDSLPKVIAPRATNDHVELDEDSPTVAIDVLANDHNGDSAISISGVSAGSAGGTIRVAADGRIHYRPAVNYNGTETFTYTVAGAKSNSTAQVTVKILPVNDPPVADDNRYTVLANRSYRMNVLNNDSTGADADETLTISSTGRGSAGAKIATDGRSITYTPAHGFAGTETFTYTINDGTVGSSATATITVHVEQPESEVLDFHDYSIDTYGGNQDMVGAALVEDGDEALRLLGNTWKKIDLPYTITPNTVLEFDFSSASRGEIHGIGLDNDTTITSSRTFRLYGSQAWGIADYATYKSQAGTIHYVIPVGKFYTGKAAYMFFINDHDIRNPNAQSIFSNVRIYEAKQTATMSVLSEPDAATAAGMPEIRFSDQQAPSVFSAQQILRRFISRHAPSTALANPRYVFCGAHDGQYGAEIESLQDLLSIRHDIPRFRMRLLTVFNRAA